MQAVTPASFNLPANRRFAVRIGARAVLVWMIVGIAALIAQHPLTSLLLPLFESAIDILQQDFTATLLLVQEKGEWVIQMAAYLARPLALTDRVVLPAFAALPPFQVSVDHALVPLVLLLTAVASWPFVSGREAAVRTVLTIAAAPLVLALSTPLLLVGRQQMIFVEAAMRQGASFHEPALVTLMIFMESGGRWLVPLVLAVACIAASRRLCVKPGGIHLREGTLPRMRGRANWHSRRSSRNAA